MGVVVVDNTAVCFDGDFRRRAFTRSVVMHRISFAADDGASGAWEGVHPIQDCELTAPLVAARFRDRRADGTWRDRPGVATRGQMPYHIVVRTDGTIDQALLLSDTGAHALKFNTTAIGVAVVGDFRAHAPTKEQWSSCVWLVERLMGRGCDVFGHTERDGASNDPLKDCPGAHCSVPRLRIQAAIVGSQMDPHTALKELIAAGLRE